MAGTEAQSGYAPVGDLNMYYEISGDGRPTIPLHGAYQTIDTIGPLLPGLAETRKVIAVEQQGHGRTADIDRPLAYEQMADATFRSDGMPAEVLAVPLDHARALRREPDRGRVPPDRTRPRRLPEAGREAQATRHDGLRLAGGGHPGDRRAHADRPGRLRRASGSSTRSSSSGCAEGA